jgi:hypothetical protein
MNQQETDELNGSLNLVQQLIAAKIEAESWKLKYEEAVKQTESSRYEEAVSNAIGWHTKYLVFVESYDRLCKTEYETRCKTNEVERGLLPFCKHLFDFLETHDNVSEQWSDLMMLMKLINADKFLKLKEAMEKAQAHERPTYY